MEILGAYILHYSVLQVRLVAFCRSEIGMKKLRRAISIPFMLVGLVFALLAGLFYLIDNLIIGEGEQ
ncbi:hypothetical protein [Sphingobium fluviale]|uniref:Uncharacterized protein n=1 Tax=Sphingobium fluviale TaxID=2506423 RepID=A0A4Q1KHT4_9SPHN|nr:hypothetical protein [Sphingobium fluviale]RXR28925.1 hypothetical protein EQG66_07560 [Sphingobium fluviale]